MARAGRRAHRPSRDGRVGRAVTVAVEHDAFGREGKGRLEHHVRRLVLERKVADVDLRLRDEAEPDVDARVDVSEGDVEGGGGGGHVVACADCRERAGEDGGGEEDAGACGAVAAEEGDSEEELGLEAGDGGEIEVGDRGLEGKGGYIGVGARGWVRGVLF